MKSQSVVLDVDDRGRISVGKLLAGVERVVVRPTAPVDSSWNQLPAFEAELKELVCESPSGGEHVCDQAFAARLVECFKGHCRVAFGDGCGCAEMVGGEIEPALASRVWLPGAGSIACAACISRSIASRFMAVCGAGRVRARGSIGVL
jgi:hypothetical protein